MSRRHEVKVWPSYFAAIKSGQKTFEWRRNDRDYAVGDVLVLREYDPTRGAVVPGLGYTGECVEASITYKAEGVFGIPVGYCVLAIRVVTQ